MDEPPSRAIRLALSNRLLPKPHWYGDARSEPQSATTLQTKRATVLVALPGLGWCDWLRGSASRFSQFAPHELQLGPIADL